MPKVSSHNSYSNRHIRRLRDNLTKLDIKRLNSQKCNADSIEKNTEDLNTNKNVAFSDENDYDYIPTNENENEYIHCNEYIQLDEESEINNTVITQRKEEEERVGVEEKLPIEEIVGVDEEEGNEEENELEKLLDFDFEFENEHNISDGDSDCGNEFFESSCSEDEEEEEKDEKHNKNNKFKSALCQWALLYNIPLIALTALLLLLLTFTDYVLPRTARTLLKTPINTKTTILSDDGEYLHLGLLRALQAILKTQKSKGINKNNLNLYINIDGLPIYKSSKKSLWLIFCSEVNSKSVYLIGAYFGEHHPANSNEFLSEFVKEAKIFCESGIIFEGRRITVNIYGLICNAPAKSLVLKVKGHTGYHCCPKCKIKGDGILPEQIGKNKKKKRRVCFPGLGPFSKRTDLEFASNVYLGTYQQGEATVLTQIPRFGAVSNVPIDYMHLVLLGIMKKLILLWLTGPTKVRLSSSDIDKISINLIELKKSQPSEFARRPRSLRDVKYWKATEFRNILLYSGPIVLKNVLNEELYTNFLALHVSLTIISSPILIKIPGEIDYAQELIEYFITTFEIIYGKEYMSYNLHNLLHLCEDVKKYGPVDEFSAFKFENYMTTVKKKLRKTNKPLQQLARRYAEEQAVEEMNINQPDIVLKHSHFEGPLINNGLKIKKQYKTL
ncbi:uncharacterized protein LOC122507574 [Leptopilina heterotoma]|uniref:uncharacterized protein LOC122507574 n=1 Tax=Leptopilina heterotoma TaxID=63436 RepID=UPI001CA9EE4D|nr:uncharacterized protein LOC122507574 [Leptopilina heterotoma]